MLTMKKKVLITGGTGFLGSTFISKYSDQYEFLIISRQNIKNSIHPDNLNLKTVQDFKPEFFIHLAANATLALNPTSITDIIRTNIEFPTQVLELFMLAGGKKVLNIGSYWEHKNNSSYSPNSLYAASKKAFEDLLQYYVDVRGAEAITLKIFDNYGKNDPRKKILRLVYDAHRNQTPLDLSGGEQLLNFLHAEDIAEAFNVALNKIIKSHQFFLVKSEKTSKLKEIVNEFCRVNNLTPKLNWGVREYGPYEFFEEITVHPILPGWSPKISFQEGFKDLYQG